MLVRVNSKIKMSMYIIDNRDKVQAKYKIIAFGIILQILPLMRVFLMRGGIGFRLYKQSAIEMQIIFKHKVNNENDYQDCILTIKHSEYINKSMLCQNDAKQGSLCLAIFQQRSRNTKQITFLLCLAILFKQDLGIHFTETRFTTQYIRWAIIIIIRVVTSKMNVVKEIINQENMQRQYELKIIKWLSAKTKTQRSVNKSAKLQIQTPRNINKRIKKKNRRIFWSQFQQRSYYEFIEKHLTTLLKPPKERIFFKINKRMSEVIQSRTRKQCHSHHQKMLQKYSTLERLVSALRQRFSQSKGYISKCEPKESPQIENELTLLNEESLKKRESVETRNHLMEIDGFLSLLTQSQNYGSLSSE